MLKIYIFLEYSNIIYSNINTIKINFAKLKKNLHYLHVFMAIELSSPIKAFK